MQVITILNEVHAASAMRSIACVTRQQSWREQSLVTAVAPGAPAVLEDWCVYLHVGILSLLGRWSCREAIIFCVVLSQNLCNMRAELVRP